MRRCNLTWLIVLTAALIVFYGCKSDGPARQTQDGVLKNYVKTPLDKARNAEDEMNVRDQQIKDQIGDNLFEDPSEDDY